MAGAVAGCSGVIAGFRATLLPITHCISPRYTDCSGDSGVFHFFCIYTEASCQRAMGGCLAAPIYTTNPRQPLRADGETPYFVSGYTIQRGEKAISGRSLSAITIYYIYFSMKAAGVSTSCRDKSAPL